ncbi:MAG: RidA family protein [Nitrospirales bacterium]|nr:RidA family protein [Nitrospira sp.]MDR4462439.1 RidA family protein [Nitrospirales bacterium]MDR4484461.1 RidA family protein [Nitrospirales bacterium]
MSVHETLSRLGLDLPAAPSPVGSYVPARQAGDLIFVSGVLPFRNGIIAQPGKLGRELTVEEGAAAAQLAMLNGLAILQEMMGDFTRLKQVVRLTGHVASAEGFVDQPAVINGASDLLVQLFGDSGRHARLALGAFELPLHAPIELELIVQMSPS